MSELTDKLLYLSGGLLLDGADISRKRIEEIITDVLALEEENRRLDSENRHVATYHPGWPEIMEAYKRGRAGAVEDLTYVGDFLL